MTIVGQSVVVIKDLCKDMAFELMWYVKTWYLQALKLFLLRVGSTFSVLEPGPSENSTNKVDVIPY